MSNEPFFKLTEIEPPRPAAKHEDPKWLALYHAVCRMLEEARPGVRQIKQASTKIGPYKVVGKRFRLQSGDGSTVTEIEFLISSETIGEVVDRLMKHPGVQTALKTNSTGD